MSEQLAQHFMDVLSPVGDLTSRKMFGATCLYIDGKPFALIDEGALFLKTDQALRDELVEAGGRPFTYFQKGKNSNVEMSYCAPPEGMIDDVKELLAIARKSAMVARSDKKAPTKKKAPAKKKKKAAKKKA